MDFQFHGGFGVLHQQWTAEFAARQMVSDLI